RLCGIPRPAVVPILSPIAPPPPPKAPAMLAARLACALAALVALTAPGRAGDIVLGMSAAFTGPSRGLGIEMYRGAMACFAEVNRQGGVHGNKIVLKAYDDGYNPAPALANTRTLLQDDHVFLLFGYVATPTTHRRPPVPRPCCSSRATRGPTPSSSARSPALSRCARVRTPRSSTTSAPATATRRPAWWTPSSSWAASASPSSTRSTPTAAAAGTAP